MVLAYLFVSTVYGTGWGGVGVGFMVLTPLCKTLFMGCGGVGPIPWCDLSSLGP